MILTQEVNAAKLSELLEQVQAGNEIVLTQDQKPIAKLIPTRSESLDSGAHLRIRTFKGHQVLTPNISQAAIADEMFGQK